MVVIVGKISWREMNTSPRTHRYLLTQTRPTQLTIPSFRPISPSSDSSADSSISPYYSSRSNQISLSSIFNWGLRNFGVNLAICSSMASLSVPCPNYSALLRTPNPNSNQCRQHPHLVSLPSIHKSNFLGGLLLGHSAFLKFQQSSRNQSGFRVNAQFNEVAVEKFSSSKPAPETKSKDKVGVPDAASIEAFMTQVADLVELVDSRDIVEMKLKQQGCEVIIRKRDTLPHQSASAPVYMMQSPPAQPMLPSQLPPLQVNNPTSAVSVPSPPITAPSSPPQPSKSSHLPLKCPMAGTFYRSPAPGAPHFVKVGDKVQKGQVICIIEAMKLMNEIEADHSGTIVEILLDDGKPVSVDTPLFVIEP